MVESERLDYYRRHQKEMRVDLYRGLSDAYSRGETDASTLGKKIILPSSFIGGSRYLAENYKDAMAICTWAGYPDIFLTFTCNPAWPEIKRFCSKMGLDPSDRPDILTRIFNLKLEALMKVLKDDQIFGELKAGTSLLHIYTNIEFLSYSISINLLYIYSFFVEVYTIEFQKRGLPHVHIILFLEDDSKVKDADDVDKIISAELPDKIADPELYELVGKYMMHGPCGQCDTDAPCMRDVDVQSTSPKNSQNTPLWMSRVILHIEGETTEEHLIRKMYLWTIDMLFRTIQNCLNYFKDI